MEIEKLSLTDLKSCWDFVKNDLKEMEETAKKKKISSESIPAFNEVKEIENKLYHRLLNITRQLK